MKIMKEKENMDLVPEIAKVSNERKVEPNEG